MLQLVCRKDDNCARLIGAARASAQLRRLFDCVPRGCTLWRLYRSWTYEVACAAGCIPAQQTIAFGTDPRATKLSTVNRLHVRGFTRLGVLHARPSARPAYIPTAARIQSWADQVQRECDSDAFVNTATQLMQHTHRSNVLIEHEVLRGGAICINKDAGCLKLVEQHTEAAILYHKRLYLASVQHTLLQLAARLYVRLNRLGLNAAERDYLFMLHAAEHDDTPPQ